MEPWIAPLTTGAPEAAWDLLVDRYRRLIFAAIQKYTREPDDVMDVFASVCEALRENDFARLRRYAAKATPDRRFSTWLCAVVHNLAIDWIRHRDGRQRLGTVASALPLLQRQIFERVFVDARSHVETYELLRAGAFPQLSFRDFLKELAATYRVAGSSKRERLVIESVPALPEPEGEALSDPAVLQERISVLDDALRSLPDEDRLAVQLYIMEGMPAEQVARALGYPNAKAVYNRTYRALAQLRSLLEAAGITVGDL